MPLGHWTKLPDLGRQSPFFSQFPHFLYPPLPLKLLKRIRLLSMLRVRENLAVGAAGWVRPGVVRRFLVAFVDSSSTLHTGEKWDKPRSSPRFQTPSTPPPRSHCTENLTFTVFPVQLAFPSRLQGASRSCHQHRRARAQHLVRVLRIYFNKFPTSPLSIPYILNMPNRESSRNYDRPRTHADNAAILDGGKVSVCMTPTALARTAPPGTFIKSV